jgi:hypothetical protein
MENMLPPSDSILGCQICIPDQVLIEKGKALRVLKTERDGCITEVNRNKTHLMDVLRFFMQVAIDKKRAVLAEMNEKAMNEVSEIQHDAVSNNTTPYNLRRTSIEDTLYDPSLTEDSPLKKSSKSKIEKSPSVKQKKKGKKGKNKEDENLLISQFYKD